MSGKKDLFGSAIGGGGLSNFLDKIDKLRKQQSFNNNENPSTSTASNLISNLAISFQKNFSSSQSKATKGDTPSTPAASNLLIVDEFDIDDNESKFTGDDTYSFNSAKSAISQQSHKSQFPSSQSDFDLNKKLIVTDQKDKPATSLSNSNTVDPEFNDKMSTSSSFYKLSSVLDDLTKNPTINSVVDEAENLKRKLLTKKKSIELSIENITSKKKPTAPQMPLVVKKIENIDMLENNDNAILDAKSENIENVTIQKTESIDNTIISSDDDLVNTEAKEDLDIATEDPKPSHIVVHLKKRPETIFSWSFMVKNKHTLIPIALSVIVYFIIFPVRISAFLFVYLIGFLVGVGFTSLIFYIMIKLDFIKYLNLTDNTEDSVQIEPVKSEEETKVDNIHSLLIQTPFLKENKTFNGIYKVLHLLFLKNEFYFMMKAQT